MRGRRKVSHATQQNDRRKRKRSPQQAETLEQKPADNVDVLDLIPRVYVITDLPDN